jgi:ADP-heptose:LPS heptosyltransferase
MSRPAKVLLIRFSSFGDILATGSVVASLAQKFPGAEVHWLTREDFAQAASLVPGLHKLWHLPSARRQTGFKARLHQLGQIWDLCQNLRQQQFTHIYDAHNTLRSNLISWGVRSLRTHFLQKSQYRFRRLLLFKFHKNIYPKPFTLQRALLEPLAPWGISKEPPAAPVLKISPLLKATVRQKLRFPDPEKPLVVLAASASFALKRWPLPSWKALILKRTDLNFALMGGPEDLFLRELSMAATDRCLNLAGQLDYSESCAVVDLAKAVVSNDTGIMHAAEQLAKPCVALLGPAPFGIPCRPLTLVLEKNLACRPCSKHGQGPCVNPEFQKCMVDISVDEVDRALSKVLSGV